MCAGCLRETGETEEPPVDVINRSQTHRRGSYLPHLLPTPQFCPPMALSPGAGAIWPSGSRCNVRGYISAQRQRVEKHISVARDDVATALARAC